MCCPGPDRGVGLSCIFHLCFIFTFSHGSIFTHSLLNNSVFQNHFLALPWLEPWIKPPPMKATNLCHTTLFSLWKQKWTMSYSSTQSHVLLTTCKILCSLTGLALATPQPRPLLWTYHLLLFQHQGFFTAAIPSTGNTFLLSLLKAPPFPYQSSRVLPRKVISDLHAGQHPPTHSAPFPCSSVLST